MRTLCDVCESAAAILFCAADEAALFRSCDDKLLFVFGTTYDEDTGRHVADYSGVKVDAPKVINHAPEAETHDIEKMVDDHDQSLKFTLWKNENDQSEIKWMSSELRLMRKMKVSDHGNIKFEDQKQQVPSSVINHDHHQSSMINNASDYDNHPPIRVCADFNTTKTPLWGSGPKGPKLDAAVHQFENQKLVQKLQTQKLEINCLAEA